MNTATNWIPGLLVLATGLAAALVYLFGTKKPESGDVASGAVDDLEAKYQRLMAELKGHVAHKHLLSAEVWAEEKERLEQAAAAVLREQSGVKHEAVKQQARLEKKAHDAARGANPAVIWVVVGGLVLAFFAYLGLSVSDSAKPRQDGMSATGAQGPQGPMQTPQEDPRLQALASRVQANPEDLEALSGLALYLISRQGFSEAKPLLTRAALIDPYHVKSRVGRAVLKAVDGDVAQSQTELEQLGARYPEAYDAHLYAGLLALDQNDPRRAVGQLERYVNTAPPSEQPPMIRAEVEKMKAELSGAPMAP